MRAQDITEESLRDFLKGESISTIEKAVSLFKTPEAQRWRAGRLDYYSSPLQGAFRWTMDDGIDWYCIHFDTLNDIRKPQKKMFSK